MSNIVVPGSTLPSNMDQELKMISCSLMQKNNKKNGTPGTWRFSVGEERPKLTQVVPLFFHKTRVLTVAPGSSKLLCASDDFFNPSSRIENPISQKCCDDNGNPICPLAKWGTDKPDKVKLALERGLALKSKPTCEETYNIFFVDQNGSIPYRISLQSSNIKAAQNLYDLVKFKNKPSYMLAVDANIHEASSGENRFYKVSFSNINDVKDVDHHKAIYERYAPLILNLMANQFEKEAEEVPF